jgi:prephenate dehydratase
MISSVHKIESRPQPRNILSPASAWSYGLFLDFEGAPEVDHAVARALENVREFSSEVVILGSYPRQVVKYLKAVHSIHYSSISLDLL